MNSSKSGYFINSLCLQAGFESIVNGEHTLVRSHLLLPEAEILVFRVFRWKS